MSDLIDRQAVIDAINTALDRETLLNRLVRKVALDAIKSLPSAQPERNGRWHIEEKDSIYGKKYILTCSECDDIYAVSEDALPYEKYCRNCGSRNRRADA